jgi:hypothetical protein
MSTRASWDYHHRFRPGFVVVNERLTALVDASADLTSCSGLGRTSDVPSQRSRDF